MVRQAHSYLAGAVSSTVMIGGAVLCFVVLVWAQAFQPILGLPDGVHAHPSAISSAPAPVAGRVLRARPLRIVRLAPTRRHQVAGPIATARGTRSAALAPNRDLGTAAPGRRAAPPGAGVPPAGEASSGSGSHSAEVRAESTGVATAPLGGASTPPSTGGGPGAAAGDLGSVIGGAINNTVTAANQPVAGAINQSGVTAVSGVALGTVGATGSTVDHAVEETVGAVAGLLHGSR